MPSYEKTDLEFFATMYKPAKDGGKVVATCVVPIKRLKESMSKGFLACEAAGKDKILLKIISTAGGKYSGKGDFWLTGEPPTERKQEKAPADDKPTSNW